MGELTSCSFVVLQEKRHSHLVTVTGCPAKDGISESVQIEVACLPI